MLFKVPDLHYHAGGLGAILRSGLGWLGASNTKQHPRWLNILVGNTNPFIEYNKGFCKLIRILDSPSEFYNFMILPFRVMIFVDGGDSLSLSPLKFPSYGESMDVFVLVSL